MGAAKCAGATKQLTLREKSFLDHYTNPDTPATFGNATQSYSRVYHRPPDETSRTEGRRILTRPHVRNELEIITEKLGWNIEVRLGQLADISKGRTPNVSTTTTYSVGKNGKRKRTGVTETSVVRAADRIRAIAIANRMTGADAVGDALRQVAVEETKRLYERVVRPKSRK